MNRKKFTMRSGNKPAGFKMMGATSPMKVAGAFITEIDELTGEKTQKRVSYDEAVEHKKGGGETVFTHQEAQRIIQDENEKLREEGRDDTADLYEGHMKDQMKNKREDKQTKDAIKARKIDEAAQKVVENKK